MCSSDLLVSLSRLSRLSLSLISLPSISPSLAPFIPSLFTLPPVRPPSLSLPDPLSASPSLSPSFSRSSLAPSVTCSLAPSLVLIQCTDRLMSSCTIPPADSPPASPSYPPLSFHFNSPLAHGSRACVAFPLPPSFLFPSLSLSWSLSSPYDIASFALCLSAPHSKSSSFALALTRAR